MTNEHDLPARAAAALNRLAKWRSVFAGWQLGTRLMDNPESAAVRDHREATIILRAEVNAITGLLLSKGVFTEMELTAQMLDEAEHLDKMYAEKFPGFTATDTGISVDLQVAAETMRQMHWAP